MRNTSRVSHKLVTVSRLIKLRHRNASLRASMRPARHFLKQRVIALKDTPLLARLDSFGPVEYNYDNNPRKFLEFLRYNGVFPLFGPFFKLSARRGKATTYYCRPDHERRKVQRRSGNYWYMVPKKKRKHSSED